MALLAHIEKLVAPLRQDSAAVNWDDPGWRMRDDRLLWHGQPFTGQREQHRAGRLLRRADYRNGALHGELCRWYPDGRLYSRERYADGRKCGVQASWWGNGHPRYEYRFVDGVAQGPAREWHENGRLARRFDYQNGRQSGTQMLYDKRGRLQRCYRFEQGRRVMACAAEVRHPVQPVSPARRTA